jgi:hypothetical protein
LFAGALYRIRPGGMGGTARGDPLVTTGVVVPNTGHRLYLGQAVFDAGPSGPTPRFLYNWVDEEPFDLLGESGDCAMPERIMGGCLLTWRSRAAAAPGLFALPEEPARGPGRPAVELLSRRGLPADPADPDSARADRVLGAILTALVLVHVVGLLRGA